MRSLATLRSLSREDRRLLWDAFRAAVIFRLALYFFTIERLRRLASRKGKGGRPVGRIVWAAQAAARRVPGSTCLSSALTLQRLLSAHGHASELHIGVLKEAGKFEAHAWVEKDSQVLIGEDERRTYTRLVSWNAGHAPEIGADRASGG